MFSIVFSLLLFNNLVLSHAKHKRKYMLKIIFLQLRCKKRIQEKSSEYRWNQVKKVTIKCLIISLQNEDHSFAFFHMLLLFCTVIAIFASDFNLFNFDIKEAKVRQPHYTIKKKSSLFCFNAVFVVYSKLLLFLLHWWGHGIRFLNFCITVNICLILLKIQCCCCLDMLLHDCCLLLQAWLTPATPASAASCSWRTPRRSSVSATNQEWRH